ncbi:MAG: hypothetical protein ACQGVC_17100 [Myxococcota bacterium]
MKTHEDRQPTCPFCGHLMHRPITNGTADPPWECLMCPGPEDDEPEREAA